MIYLLRMIGIGGQREMSDEMSDDMRNEMSDEMVFGW